jgi:hypothetical protein
LPRSSPRPAVEKYRVFGEERRERRVIACRHGGGESALRLHHLLLERAAAHRIGGT